MNPRFDDYAADPDVARPGSAEHRGCLAAGARILPVSRSRARLAGDGAHLEDCGLLRFEYEGLCGDDGLLAENELWEAGFTVREGRGESVSSLSRPRFA